MEIHPRRDTFGGCVLRLNVGRRTEQMLHLEMYLDNQDLLRTPTRVL